MADLISTGAVQNLFFSEPAPESGVFVPTLQILSVKKIQTPQGNQTDRYRIILSDGQHYLQSMLATQLNSMVEQKQIDRNSLVKLTGYSMNIVQNRRLLILLTAEVISNTINEKIGTPVPIDNAGKPSGGAPAAAAPAAPAAAPAPPAPATREQKPGPAQAQGGSGFGARATRGGAAGRGGRGGAAGGGGGGAPGNCPIYPIEGLSPYQSKWTIKARVINKSEVKHWSNQRGEGKLFSVTLMDETGEIRATGFNDAVDNFYEMLQEGKVFYISRARINIAKKQFSNVNNDYEIMFENNTEIEPCDDANVPQVQYKFTPISDIANVEKDQTVDVIAVIKEVGELGSINSKATQKPFAKRDLTLVDQSQWSVRLTLWGKQAESFTHEDNPVVAFKGVKVGDFGGRSLSMYSSSTMSMNPDIEQAHALKGWFDAEGNSVQYNTYTNSGVGAGSGGGASSIRPDEIKTIGQIKDENIGTSDKMEYFSTKATINFVKHETFSYPACPAEGCNKKVVEESDGWRCEKCDRVYPSPAHRYILSLSIMDHTGHIWVTAFNEVGEQLLGVTANQLIEMKDTDETAFSAIFTKAQARSLNFACSAKQDTFNDQTRVRYSIRRAVPIDYKNEALALAKLIEAM